MMLDDGLDRTMCRSPVSGCRQSAFSGKSDDGKQIRRRRNENRRMKMSVDDPCSTWSLEKQRRFGSIDGSGSGSGSGGSNLSVPGDFRVEGTSRLRPQPTAARSSSCCSRVGVATGDAVPDTRHRSMSVIGRRREMEDAVVVQPGFVASKDGAGKKFDFYGVYDGHGGSRVALACRDGLHRLLAAEMERELERAGEMEMEMGWEKVMTVSFARMDEEVNETETVGATGSTAVVAVVGEEVLVVANCGDSRAVLSRGGSTVALSDDHKPDRPDELARIEDSGGRVIDWDGQRVLGVLATSRSIGDQQLKPYVISKPEVIVTRRSNMDEFLILASDGLWDVMSSEMACHVVRKCMSGRVHRRRPNGEECVVDSAAVLTELAIAKGSRDNISVIVVELNKHDP